MIESHNDVSAQISMIVFCLQINPGKPLGIILGFK